MGQAAVKRYWPGRAPDWYNEKEEEQSESEAEPSEEDEADVTAIAPPVVIKASDDPRLRRLAQVFPDLSSTPLLLFAAIAQVRNSQEQHHSSACHE